MGSEDEVIYTYEIVFGLECWTRKKPRRREPAGQRQTGRRFILRPLIRATVLAVHASGCSMPHAEGGIPSWARPTPQQPIRRGSNRTPAGRTRPGAAGDDTAYARPAVSNPMAAGWDAVARAPCLAAGRHRLPCIFGTSDTGHRPCGNLRQRLTAASSNRTFCRSSLRPSPPLTLMLNRIVYCALGERGRAQFLYRMRDHCNCDDQRPLADASAAAFLDAASLGARHICSVPRRGGGGRMRV
jgi:hypothetical protein